MSGEEICALLKQDLERLKREITYLKCKVEEHDQKTKSLEEKLKNKTQQLIFE